MDRIAARYERIADQLTGLFTATEDPSARMATAAALLHHKMDHFFWTGFYRLVGRDLIVGPYQGPVACQVLSRDKGVCWACVREKKSILVPRVEEFPGHIACDSRSRSEIAVPVFASDGSLAAVLDVDSKTYDAFSSSDASGLEKIAHSIYH